MYTAQPQTHDVADLQVGDTVRYEKLFYNTTGLTTDDGIIIHINRLADTNTYQVFNHTYGHANLPVITEERIVERLSTEYRGMSGNYILSLHGAGWLEV